MKPSTVDPFAAEAANIRLMVGNVTQETSKATAEYLLGNYGPYSTHRMRFILNTLMDATVSDKQPNEDRVALLEKAVVFAADQANAVTLLADIFDNTVVSPSVEKATELVVKLLKLKPPQQLIFALALSHSTNKAWAIVGHKMVEKRADAVKSISSDKHLEVFSQLAHLAQTTKDMEAVAKAIVSERPLPEALPGASSVADCVTTLEASLSLARIIEELGPVCVATQTACQDLLRMYPGTLTEKVVAECVGLLASSQLTQSDTNAYASLRMSLDLPDTQPPSQSAPVNVANFVMAVKESEPSLNWMNVMKAMDQPRVRLDRFSTVAAAYKRGGGGTIPVSAFVGRWKNTAVQAAALRFFIDNPELVNNDLKGPSLPAAVAESTTDLSALWTNFAFIEAVVHVASRERGFDSVILAAAEKAPTALFVMCATSKPSGTVKHLVLASLILRKAGTRVLSPEVVEHFNSESQLTSLIGLMSEYCASEPCKTSDVVDCIVAAKIAPQIVKVCVDMRFVVYTAICARESNQVAENWLDVMLDASNSRLPIARSNRFAVAAAVVDVCDELIAKQRAVTAATTALTTLTKSSIASQMPNLVMHAKHLLSGGAGTFPPDIESEATEFFKRIYSDDSISPVGQCEILVKSSRQRDREIFNCILNVLFEETRCLTDYPWKELTIAGRLFGQLIAKDLMGNRLQNALRIILQTLVKPIDGKTLEYGITALQEFRDRLPEWPQFGKQLKQVNDLDMRIPGIMASINKSLNPKPQQPVGVEEPEGGKQNQTSTVTPGLHQHDIRILMSEKSMIAPAQILQDQINFLVGNTDPNNLEASARELAEILKPEFFPYFAEYIVVKRASLEPNFHRMYISLLERINAVPLDKAVRRSTVAAVSRVLTSDTVRTSQSERTLLKNLGAWFGMLTVAKNKPVLIAEMNFKQMLYQALEEGKLIAVVPFIAKVLEQCGTSTVFAPPNPWTMGQLIYLLEMYHLPDLKLTLRFEVEVLCKSFGITLSDVEHFAQTFPRVVKTTMLDVRRGLEINGSTDFRVDENAVPRGDTPPARQTKLQADATPYQPRVSEPNIPPRVPATITEKTVRIGEEVELVRDREAPYTQALVKSLEASLKELKGNVERSAIIAAYAARQLVSKDLTRDPDVNSMRRYAQAMARHFAMAHCAVSCREQLFASVRKTLTVLIQHITNDESVRARMTEHVFNNNVELCNRVLEYQAGEEAIKKVDECIAPLIEEKTVALRSGSFPIVPADQLQLSRMLDTFPETLRPSASLPVLHRNVYEDLIQTPQTALNNIIRAIELDANAHYGAYPPKSRETLLLITNPAFTEHNMSEYHRNIKNRLLEISAVVQEAPMPLVSHIFGRLMEIQGHISKLDAAKLETTQCVAHLLGDVCLFVIKSARGVLGQEVTDEVSKMYVSHPQRFTNSELVVLLVRWQVVDLQVIDKALADAIAEQSASHHTNRSITDFAAQLVQKLLIDTKHAQTKDLRQTLDRLEEITKAAKPRAPGADGAAPGGGQPITNILYKPAVQQIRVVSMHQQERRKVVEELFAEWNQIAKMKLASEPGQTQKMSMDYVKKLQSQSMLKAGTNLEQFIGIIIDISVEEYSTVALRLQRQGSVPEDKSAGAPPRPGTAPAHKFNSSPEMVSSVDATIDLIILLVRCCGWVSTEDSSSSSRSTTMQAEVALVNKVLSIVGKVLVHNHDAVAKKKAADAPPLPPNEAYQVTFMQQPYVRFLSNLLISLNRSVQSNEDPNVVVEIMRPFSSILHVLEPSTVPGFAFGWLELISHRVMISRHLGSKRLWPSYCRLLCDGLRFVDVLTRGGTIASTSLLLFKGFLKLMLVVLHDFPSFLLANHQQLCDAIPATCVQLRNVVLSAFPASTTLPDPFDPSVNIEALQEMRELPPLQDMYKEILTGPEAVISLDEISGFIKTRKPARFPELIAQRLQRNSQGKYNVPLINSVVLHAAVMTLENTGNRVTDGLQDSAILDMLIAISRTMDSEGRYLLLNACANHLRFPNCHTHLFSKIMLFLYSANIGTGDQQEVLQEQVTRVLVERLIISRPHPWGLLVTFIELIKNPKYRFLEKPFTRCTPEIEKMFDSVGTSIRGRHEK